MAEPIDKHVCIYGDKINNIESDVKKMKEALLGDEFNPNGLLSQVAKNTGFRETANRGYAIFIGITTTWLVVLTFFGKLKDLFK